MQKITILWADDEMDLLKPHILFLKAKGYDVVTVNNGEDAIEQCENNDDIDVVFLDENMPGVSGLDALQRIKTIKPNIPVVMITKSEEEKIMEEAIGSKISDYLIKPVNPNQILLSLKKLIDNKRLISEKTSSNYQQDFRHLSMAYNERLTAKEWAELYTKLVYWEIELQDSNDPGMIEVFNSQKVEANSLFSKFIDDNYLDWMKYPDDETPVLSHTVFSKYLNPLLKDNIPTLLVVIDNLRLDQLKVIESLIDEYYRQTQLENYFSILPTSTEYARNALFAGLLPLDIQKRFPAKWQNADDNESSRNQHEAFFFGEYLTRNGLNVKHSYSKISSITQGKNFIDNISNYGKNQLNVLVYNFVDMLSHARTEMNVIKELAEDEAAYRSITKSWFEHSPLFEIIKWFANKKHRLVITTDHGTVKVTKPTRIIGDRETTTNLRYKEGKNLNYDDNDLFVIKKPEEAGLTKPHLSSTYVFAKNDKFFCYPNNYNYYANFYRDTFQHGGISLEEIIIPFAVYEAR